MASGEKFADASLRDLWVTEQEPLKRAHTQAPGKALQNNEEHPKNGNQQIGLKKGIPRTFE